jgi:hypothetical protein
MNNSKLALDSIGISLDKKVDRASFLREREQKLIHIIEDIKGISESQAWRSLKTEVFDGLVTTLEKELREEAKKDTPDTLKLNRLAGQLKWAEKYSDFDKLANIFRVELNGIRTMLYGKTD